MIDKNVRDALREVIAMVDQDMIRVRASDREKFLIALERWNAALTEPIGPAVQGPVAVVDANDDGFWADILPDRSVKVGQFLYARSTPEAVRELIDVAECFLAPDLIDLLPLEFVDRIKDALNAVRGEK